MRRLALLFLPFLLCLSSCAPLRSEPEQISVVSAVGFDGGERLQVFLEIALVGGETGKGIKTAVLTGEGDDVKSALHQISLGSQKALEFSHCALMALGDSLTEQQLEEVFRFAGMGEQIPLEASVVSVETAGALLKKETSEVAVGYGIPQLLRQLQNTEGVELRQTVYELRSAPDPWGVAVLPRLRVGEEQAVAALEGLRILRRGGKALSISTEALLPYAMLAGRFSGVRDTANASAHTPRTAKSALGAEWTEDGLALFLRVEGKTVAPTEDGGASLSASLRASMTALLAEMQEVGVDPFSIGLRLQKNDPALWSRLQGDYQGYFSEASFAVSFVWNGGSET